MPSVYKYSDAGVEIVAWYLLIKKIAGIQPLIAAGKDGPDAIRDDLAATSLHWGRALRIAKDIDDNNGQAAPE